MLRNLKNTFKSIGKSLDGPIVIKDYQGSEKIIEELELLKSQISDDQIIESIELDAILIKHGDLGERNVSYELKNSFLPMYILHNITIVHEGYRAQLDFVLITSKFICILETKKLNGDITITNDGNFIRHFKSKNGKVFKKEGMYSPISQNERHVRILQDLLIKEKLINNMPVLSLVVIANSKSIINNKYAPKAIKNQIVKYDLLTKRIKSMMTGDIDMPIVSMEEIGDYLINNSHDGENTFLNKYKSYVNEDKVDVSSIIVVGESIDEKANTTITEASVIKDTKPDVIDTDLIRQELKAYRLEQSRKEGVKAYFIFNNNQMEDVIIKKPKTKDELMRCAGFGETKVEKYGEAIIGILEKA